MAPRVVIQGVPASADPKADLLTLLALWGIPVLGYSFVLAIVGAIAGGMIGSRSATL